MLKKISFIIFLMLALIFGASSCVQSNGEKELKMSSSTVKQVVKNWRIYTNPAFRYELRFPQNWDYRDSGEDGKLVAVFPADLPETGGVTIRGFSNWQERYILEDFYKHQPVDLFTGNFNNENVKINNMTGVWFKGVPGRSASLPEQKIDLVAFELGDRILEIEMRSDWDISRAVVNSLTFYGLSSLKDLPKFEK